MVQDLRLEQWAAFDGLTWETILLGNGASVNVWPRFSYSSLLEAARGEDASTPLTDSQLRLFQGIGPNFERALSRLLSAEQVLTVMGEAAAATRVRDEYERLKSALAGAVHDVHVR